jgi:spore maturation protein CgeB
VRIAFLTSIYPAHAEKMYGENPSLKNKSSAEQVEFIRWHALSSYVRWFELLEGKGFATCSFNHNLPEVALAWAKENKFEPKSNDNIHEIGLEKIKRFKPDIIFAFAPLSYHKNNFLDELIGVLSKKPRLIAWYGANCGDEEIFRYFDLTLSNSKHLVNSLRGIRIPADFLQHSFDPIILDKIKIPEKQINRVGFFGNLDISSCDFQDRTKLLEGISKKNKLLDIYGDHSKPTRKERSKYSLLVSRHKISKSINKIVSNDRIRNWSDEKNLPPTPWSLDKEFCSRIHPPLYGQQMLQKLSSYRIALNYHNRHTGDFACNMRLFEVTGIGCALLTDSKKDLSEYFDIDSEILTYSSKDEAIEKINYLKENPNKAEQIRCAGQSKCLSKHTTQNQISRLSEILNKVFN